MVWIELEREMADRIAGYQREAAVRRALPHAHPRAKVAAQLRILADCLEAKGPPGRAREGTTVVVPGRSK